MTFPTIAPADLEVVTGGAFNISSLLGNAGQIGQSIGGLVDMFKGGNNGQGAQMGGQIGGLVQQFAGLFGGGGGGGQQAAPQQG